MKELVEVTRKIKKKRREGRSSRRKSTTSVPPDIISEILSKLPLKSLMRFRCVSKLWSSVSTDPYFKKSFQAQSSERVSHILVVGFRESDGFFVLSLPQQNLQNRIHSNGSYSCSQPIDSYRMEHAKHRCPFTIETESVHGLMICFQKPNKPIVWNPSLRKLTPLSKPGKTWKSIRVFLGYDPIEGKHKVVCMPKLIYGQALDECKVLTLGSGSAQEQWRKVETIPDHFPLTGDNNGFYHARCINGVVYYHAKGDYHRVIMSFDVRSEKFRAIRLPLETKSWRMTLSYHGKLACVGFGGHGRILLMIVLEDARKPKWSSHQFSSLPDGATDDGELIFVGTESLDMIYIDPKRKTFRRIDYSHILDDFRQRNGLGDWPSALKGFQFFHTETLVSL
ncbi:unnamed protein product [Microthlaspi erraticum]|uniref:F-box domain-containing protein n=1 Tax=Microthlaspi erraticum TaxID=1685480 RepID=A0A6D2K9I0_9BRAS|nr:unnamed protein product [Microthlaspi erraticum]